MGGGQSGPISPGFAPIGKKHTENGLARIRANFDRISAKFQERLPEFCKESQIGADWPGLAQMGITSWRRLAPIRANWPGLAQMGCEVVVAEDSD